VVDTGNVNNAQYQQDLAECRQYAEQVNPTGEAAENALIGAGAGAVLGVVTGALVGGVGVGEGAAIGGALGGLGGAGHGALQGTEQQKRIIADCLQGRGYNVLDR
jgi:hypothetical protein